MPAANGEGSHMAANAGNDRPKKHLPPVLQVEQCLLNELNPTCRNPKSHPDKQIRQIAAAIREFGFNVPILADSQGKVIAGHGRLKAAKLLGLESVPVIRIEHLTEEQKRAFMIADNKLALNADWDHDNLAFHLQQLARLDLPFDVEITGFETAEIDLVLDSPAAAESARPEDQIPEIEAVTVTKSGDLWNLGDHRILCADAQEYQAFSRLLPDEKARVVFTDPPWNVAISGHAGGLGKIKHREFAMASGEMSSEDFRAFLRTICRNLVDFSADGAIHYICIDWRHIGEILVATLNVYSELKNLCVWNKNNGGMGSFYRSKHELVFVFKVGRAPHVNNIELGSSGRYRTNVWDYAGVNTFRRGRMDELAMHPTVKPVALVVDAIKDCSRRNEIVLDPFSGSGTTIIAAERSGRRARAIEIDPAYVDVAIRRWQKLTGKSAVHAETGIAFGDITQ
jgi:DNA modification methylase